MEINNVETKTTNGGKRKITPKEQKTQAQKKFFKAETYSKEFDNFGDGIEEIINIDENLLNVIKDSDDCIPETIDEGINTLIRLINENTPNTENKQNLKWEFTVSANRAFCKTEHNLGFGWLTKRDRETKEITYIFTLTIYKPNPNVKAAVEENGWKLKTVNKR